MQCKRGCIFQFHLIFVGILSILIFSVNNRGGVVDRVLLNGQNLLSMTKVICQQSLTYLCIWFYVNLYLPPLFIITGR